MMLFIDGGEAELENGQMGQPLRAGWFEGYQAETAEGEALPADFSADEWEWV